jgi:cadmium resistance protein CadD (predicted permease)
MFTNVPLCWEKCIDPSSNDFLSLQANTLVLELLIYTLYIVYIQLYIQLVSQKKVLINSLKWFDQHLVPTYMLLPIRSNH